TVEASVKVDQRLPVAVLTAEERNTLVSAAERLATTDEQFERALRNKAERPEVIDYFEAIKKDVAGIVGADERSRGGSLRERLEKLPRRPGETLVPLRTDEQADATLAQAKTVRELNEKAYSAVENKLLDERATRGPDPRTELRRLREEVLLLAGTGE